MPIITEKSTGGKTQATNRWPNIPPFFGRPKFENTNVPNYINSWMWLVKLPAGSRTSVADVQSGDTGSFLATADRDNVEVLSIQVVPQSIQVSPNSTWVTIPTIGRNNPFYQYTGGEDKISFQLDWYSNEEGNADVIRKCRWVEALSKADGYYAPPPRVLLIFGKLFRKQEWIVESAEYELSLFIRGSNMLPVQAYQNITLSRVTDRNLTTREILQRPQRSV